jgi:hypothetical protein
MKEEWDDFVWASRNGTLFHTQRFLSYHPPDRFNDHSLAFFRKNKLCAVFPAAVQLKDGKKVLNSHPGASYGGPIINDNAGIAHVFDIVEALIQYAQDNNFHKIQMRLPPRIYHKRPCNEIDFALRYKGFIIQATELTSSLQLDFDEGQILDQFKGGGRRSEVRKAWRDGVMVRESDNFATFWEILLENLARHSVTPTHSLEEIRRLKDLFPERIKLYAAFLHDKMISGVVIFVCNTNALHTFYIAHDYDYQEYRSLSCVIYEITKWGIQNGYRYLNFGISTEDKGRVINWGLFNFKEEFGARGILREEYALDIRKDSG